MVSSRNIALLSSFALLFHLSLASPSPRSIEHVTARGPTTCMSSAEYESVVTDMAKRARSYGTPQVAINCLIEMAESLIPKAAPDGTPCYTIKAYNDHMADAPEVCIVPNLPSSPDAPQPKSDSVYSNPDDGDDSGPSSLLSGTCSCTSGCHFCCVVSGTGGDTPCFLSWCAATLSQNRCN